MSNDPAKLAIFSGFCRYLFSSTRAWTDVRPQDKGIQSAGAAGVWRADAVGYVFYLTCISSIVSSELELALEHRT